MKIKSFVSLLLIVIITITTVFAESGGETNMTGVDESVGKNATSDNFKWQGTHAQGIRVTIVDGNSGARISAPIDYTNYTGTVDVSFRKFTKIEYKKAPALIDAPSYTRKTPPSGMPTVLFNTTDGGNNMEAVRTYFKRDDIVRTLIIENGLSITVEQFIEKGYKVIVEPVAYLTVNGKVHAVTATESAILSKQFNTGYVIYSNSDHPPGKPCNHVEIDSILAPDIKKILQERINTNFIRDGYYCMSSACKVTPPLGKHHQLMKNPYTWHLSSVVNRALPKSLFLEKADLGIVAGNTQSGINLSADEIIKTYGIGIIRYKDEPIDPPDPPPPGGGYAFDFVCDGITVHTNPVREENDFDVSATFTYQQKIDCKYCTTTCNLCHLTGTYPVLISPGYYTVYWDGYEYIGYWVPDIWGTALCDRCHVNCQHCDDGELWYQSNMKGEYPTPTKSALVEIYVDGATLDYTKGINGVLKYSKIMTFSAGETVTVPIVLNAGEDIGNKTVVARINWLERADETNPNNNISTEIINVIPATNLQIEYIQPNAPFRTGTEVVSSFMVINQDNIGALNIRPKHNLRADFKAMNPVTGEVIATSQMSQIVIPKGGTNLIYFKWYLPKGYTADEVQVQCHINPSRSVKETNYNDNICIGTNQVQIFREHIPLDTIFENRPPSFTKPTGLEPTPTSMFAHNVVSSVNYERWEWSGDFVKQRYNMSLSANYTLQPDDKSPSRELRAGTWQMRSGYGVDLNIQANIHSNLPMNAFTNVQNGNAYLPEFRFRADRDRYRTLEVTSQNVLNFTKNPNTIINTGHKDNKRIHFTPLW